MSRAPREAFATLGVVLAGASCSASLPDPRPEAEALARSGAAALSTNTKQCTAQRKATEPDLFGWDSGSRGKVKATAEQGLVVVHFEEHGCDIAISVLNCTTTKAAYHYTARHSQQSRIAENDADLYAHFPVAVADLRARLGASRGIRADYRVEGIDMIPIGTAVGPGDLKGSECGAATHVVSAIHRGAFAVAAGATTELRAGGTLFDGSLEQRLGVFDGDGFPEACDGAKAKGAKASGCDEPLRIELQLLAAAEAPREVDAPAPPPPAPVALALVAPAPAPAPALVVPPARSRPSLRRPPAPAPVAVAAPVPIMRGGAPEHFPTSALPPPRRPPPPPPTIAVHHGSCPAGMAEIPGGTFTMGSGEGEPGEGPAHQVTLEAYCIDVAEVTVAAYASCQSCRAPDAGDLCNAPGTGKDDHPQNCISWDDARAYCQSAGKRLPTEAQWEYAARGGPEERTWPWGESPPTSESACWGRWVEGSAGTCAVNAFPRGAFGLSDMAGNVWEWVADWYGPYAPVAAIAPAGPESGFGRAVRGGAWTGVTIGSWSLRGAIRDLRSPENRRDDLGFRCAR
jgi:formylglycine-generating enzyme required for sulfatase activity